jgi:hypothetical protein
MSEQFAKMLQSEGTPDPQLVVKTYLILAEMPAGNRPMRTVVGIICGVDEMNRLPQPIQDKILKEMQLDNVRGGISA